MPSLLWSPPRGSWATWTLESSIFLRKRIGTFCGPSFPKTSLAISSPSKSFLPSLLRLSPSQPQLQVKSDIPRSQGRAGKDLTAAPNPSESLCYTCTPTPCPASVSLRWDPGVWRSRLPEQGQGRTPLSGTRTICDCSCSWPVPVPRLL